MRVMRIVTRNNLGGPARQAVGLWHAHREFGVETLLVVGGVEGETEIDLTAAGIPEVVAVEPGVTGWIRCPFLRRRPGLAGDRRARRCLQRWMDLWRPDVVHTHTSKAGAVGRIAARRAAHRAVTVHTFHGHVLRDYFPRLVGLFLARIERRLAKTTNRLIAVSPSCADELAELGVAPRDRFSVVPPAVPEVAVTARDDVRAAEGWDGFTVGCVGRLVPIKRTGLFVDAMRGLDGATGVVFGDGPEREGLASRLPSNVRLEGARPEVPSLLSGLDLLVLPGRREGLPLVAVEAARVGVPCLGFDVPGVVDALRTWGQGTLVPESGGVSALRDAIRESMAHPAQPTGDDASLRRFETESVAKALLDIYTATRS